MSDLSQLAEALQILREPVELPSGRMQTPSVRAVRAVGILVENGGNKGDALLEAGFSEATAHTPDKVFNSPTVRALMERVGVSETEALKAIKRNVNKRDLEHMDFPPYAPEKVAEHKAMEEEGADMSEKIRGEQLTDAQIRAMYTELGIVVKEIVHGDTCRRAYFWTDDSKAQLTAADMILKITGSYAPKQVQGKLDHRVGVFSFTELRKKQQREGIKIV